MNCDQARERLAADLLGELNADERNALAAHHADCADCRADAAAQRAAWQQLGTLPAPVWSAAARARSLDALRDAVNTVNTPVTRARPWLRVAALAAAFLLGLLMPDALRPWRTDASAVDVVADTLPRYVLLFTEARDNVMSEAQAGTQMQDMMRWVNTLADQNRFVSGEKLLEGSGQVLTAGGQSPYSPAEHLTGFVIVRAGTEAEALAWARQSPVLQFGGTILVLPVDPI